MYYRYIFNEKNHFSVSLIKFQLKELFKQLSIIKKFFVPMIKRVSYDLYVLYTVFSSRILSNYFT